MMIRRLSVFAALVAVLSVTGCARSDDGVAPGAPVSPPAAAPPSDAGAQTLTGTVVAGVEPGCLLLEGDGDPHLLIFDDESLRAAAEVGAEVTVVGRAESGMMTTCQQGTPFVVTSVRPN